MSGTKPTATSKKPTTKTLAAQDISLIIESCAKHSVSLLKFGDLEIWLGPTHFGPVTPIQAPYPGNEIPDHDKINMKTLEEETSLLRETQIEELKITNPLAYEELLRVEGLEDADDEPGDDE